MRFASLFVLLLILISINLYAIDNFNISGLNEAIYVHKIVRDSLKNYFSDEFNFRIDYNKFSFGMKFLAWLPKYDRYSAISELSSNNISYKWDERFVSYNSDNFSVKAGTFEEVFGSGIVLRAYQDKDFNIDNRLEGLTIKCSGGKFNAKAFYGALPNENSPSKNDIVSGIDIDKEILSGVKFGTSFASFRELQPDNKYNEQDVLGCRTNLNFSSLDMVSEFALTKKYHGVSKEGKAIYANLNTYLGKFTLSSGYKYYHNFDFRLNDVPTVNHSLEPLYDTPSGRDEEGVLGEIRFMPNFSNEFVLNYSESWNSNFKIRQSDLYFESHHYFDSFDVTTSYSQIEQINTEWENWEKEITPEISFDFFIHKLPVMIKAEYQYFGKEHQELSESHYEPLLQCDCLYKDISFSVIAEYSYKNLDELWDNPLWIGTEVKAPVFENTDLILFVGKEKGGKVCRNGICRYQSRFKGIRLELTTSF